MKGLIETRNSLKARKEAKKLKVSTDFAQKKPRPTFPQTRLDLQSWLRVQTLNVTRHASALCPFRHDEFGTDAASPSDAHIDVINQPMSSLRNQLG